MAIETDIIIDHTLSDDDLFTLMSFKNEDEESARRAFDVFYKKYSTLLWSLCYAVCKNSNRSNPDILAEEIFNNTMIKIYNNPSYDSSKAKVSTWMAKIAKRESYNLLVNSKGKTIVDNELVSSILDSHNESVEEIILPEKHILNEALNSLSDREKHILLTYYSYQDGNKHLPDVVLQELCAYYQTTTINLRQIKKRAFEKVKLFIRQNSNLLS